jgi:hypothetical protein
LILFKTLKLFGLDIPAKIEAVKASLELRVEQTTDHVKRVAQEAAVIAAFSAVATVTAAMAVGVGLIALYRWTADAHGVYAGLGVVGVFLVVVTAIFATAATIKGKSLGANRIKFPRHAAGTAGVTSDPDAIMSASAGDAPATEPHSSTHSRGPATGATSAAPAASASDLVEPLAFFLSKFAKYPSIGDPVVDELIGNLRATAQGAADEALARAANVVRHGDRKDLAVVLTGAVFVGWLLTHHSQQLPLKS